MSNRTGRWRPGESGNPLGKPAGSGKVQKLREALGESLPEVLACVTEAAKAGDIQAARLILDRVLPSVKPIEQPQEFSLPSGGLAVQARAVLAAAAAGEVPPSAAAQLVACISGVGKLVEIDELDARITGKRLGNTC